MSKKIALAVWALALLLSNVLLFTMNQGMTPTFWITFAFVWVAFLSALLFQCVLVRKASAPDDHFLHLPAFLFSLIYEAAQLPISVIFALGSVAVPGKAALFVQAILLILAWLLVLLSLGGNDHIKKVNSRQKNHHREL